MGWGRAQGTRDLHRLPQPNGFTHRLQKPGLLGSIPRPGRALGSGCCARQNNVAARTAGCKRPGRADCNDSRPCARPPLHTWAAAASCPQVRGQFVFVHSADVLLGFHFIRRSVGLMDKASASGAGDSRFKSWADHYPCRRKLSSCSADHKCLSLEWRPRCAAAHCRASFICRTSATLRLSHKVTCGT